MARKYEQLKVWQAAIELVDGVYSSTRLFPQEERYGLKSQMQRAAVSIASNIAEGYGRGSDAEFARFLCIARGSLFELETQITIAERQNYISRNALSQKVDKVYALLAALIRRIGNDQNQKASGVRLPASDA